MNKITCLFLCLLVALTLNNCGFTPLYAKNTAEQENNADIGVDDHLALIAISIIPERRGQILRNTLTENFHRGGAPINPAYTLTFTDIQKGIINLDITRTADSTRAQLRLTTIMTLTDNINKETLFTKNLRSITTYNILASEFATRVSETATEEKALKDLASQVETQLALYFKKGPDQPKSNPPLSSAPSAKNLRQN